MDKQVPRSGKKVTIKHVPAKVPSHVVSKRSSESSPAVSTPFSGLRHRLNLGNVPETPFESYKTPLSTTKTLRDRLREKYGDDLSPVGAMQKKLENIKLETISDQKEEAIETLTECIAQVSTHEDHSAAPASEDKTPQQFKTPYTDTFKIALQKTMPSIRSARAKEQRMTELINAHKSGHKKTVSKVVGDIETIVAPFMMENELPKSRRTQILVDYILSLADTPAESPEVEGEPKTPEALKTLQSPEREVFMTPAQEFKSSNNENESVENLMKSPTNAKKYAICSIDGAFATAFTPVRVTKQKDREKLGVQYAVSPVRRSARGISSKTTQELWKDGFEQVGDVGELLQETGYAYVPNKALDIAEAELILLNLYLTYKQQLHQQNQFSSHLLLLISQLDQNFDKSRLLEFKDALPLLDVTEFEQEISKLRQIDSRASLLESANESLETAYVTLTKQLKDVVKGFQDEREGYETTAQSLRSMISHFEKELALSHDKLVELHALVKEERQALETKDQFREKEMEVLRKALRDQIAISHNLRAENGYLEGRLKEISLSYREVTPSSDRSRIVTADPDYDSVQKEIQHLQEENARLVTLLQNTNGGKILTGATDLELELESVKKKLENQQKINKKIRKIIMQTMTVGVPSVAEDLELTVPEEIAPVLMQSIEEDNAVAESPKRETLYSKRMSKTQTSLGTESLEKDEFYSNRMAQTQVSLGQTNDESSLGRSQVSLTPFNLVNNNAAISNHIQLIDMYNHALTTISHLQVNNEILQKKLEDSNSSRRQTETISGIFLSQERKPSAINGSDTELTKLVEERDAWKDNTRRLEKEIWEVREMLQQKENALNELKKGIIVDVSAEVASVPEKQVVEEEKSKVKDIPLRKDPVIQKESRYIALFDVCPFCSNVDHPFIFDI